MVSKTSIAKVLRESILDPREPGPMKLIVDMNDPEYLMKRVSELLAEAIFNNPSEKCKQAISLLAIARIQMKESGLKEKIGVPKFPINPNTKA